MHATNLFIFKLSDTIVSIVKTINSNYLMSRFKIKLFNMFKPGDEKYNNLSLLFNCLNGLLFASLLFLHIFAIERMKSDIIIR